jgi:N-acyl-L-homoserine lactone synthetase
VAIRIKIAETAAEIDAIFRLRHSVYVDEEGYFATREDQRIHDTYDWLSTTLHVMAVHNDVVVGAARFVGSSSAGTPTDGLFDFGRHVPAEAHTAAAGMLSVAREYRRVPRLFACLTGMGFYWCTRQHVSYVHAVCNVLHERMFAHIGFRPVGKPIELDHVTVPAIPWY